jgi:hypothetical protein
MDTVPYAARMNRICSVCIIDRRQGPHGVLTPKLMLEVTMMTMMKFITAKESNSFDISGQNCYVKNNDELYTK